MKPLSRQRRYQLKHQAKGLCIQCSAKAVTASHCLKHALRQRERQHVAFGCTRINNCLTRRLEFATIS